MQEEQLRERDLHPAILVLVALALMGSVALMYFGLTRLDAHDRIVGQRATLGAPGPIEDVAEIVDEPVRAKLDGRMVALEPTPVESVVADAIFWVGEPGRRRVPVLMVAERMARQPDVRVEVNQDDRVVVYGVLLPTRESAVLHDAELLTAGERAELLRRDRYIAARRVIVTERAVEQRQAGAL